MEKNTGLYYKVVSFVGKNVIGGLEKLISAATKQPAVLNPAQFDWVPEIENNYEAIKAEYLAISKPGLTHDISEISAEQQKVVDEAQWRFFPLYIYGVPLSDNIALCPQTDRLLKNIPNVTTAFFSILNSDTVVKEHRGAFKGYLRFHLGVDIPTDYENCGIRILNDTYHWQNGKSLIFDDTFLHSAWNKSSQKRAVLYVDFIRPMPAPLVWISLLLTHLIRVSPYIQNVLKNLKQKTATKDIEHVLG